MRTLDKLSSDEWIFAFLELLTEPMTEPIRSISSGGYDGTPGGAKGESILRNILEFDQEAESWTEVGKMQEGRAEFAVSVVSYNDYAKWCK